MIIESKNILKNPQVSVIVTTYNHEHYIKQCLDSILGQKLDVAFELIISDDCSKDQTREILKLYQERNPYIIRLLFQEKNKGIKENYADVLSLTRGKYIAQIAGDDFWILDTKLQLQKDYLDTHPDCGLCYTNINTCDENGNLLERRFLDSNGRTKSFEDHLINRGYIAPLTWMYRRKFAERYDMEGAFTDESSAFALDVFAVSHIDYIDVESAMYRIVSGSLSHPTSNAKWYKQYMGVFRAQLYYCDKYKVSEELLHKILINGYINLLPYACGCGDSAFVEEAINQCQLMDVNIQPYISICEQKIKAENALSRIQKSHAYKIGKMLLKPFKWLSSKQKDLF